MKSDSFIKIFDESRAGHSAIGADSAQASLRELLQLAAHLCKAPFTLVTAPNSSQYWSYSSQRMSDSDAERARAFSTNVAPSLDPFLVIPDISVDERCGSVSLQINDVPVRFYCGVALRGSDGHRMGTLHIFAPAGHELTGDQREALLTLGRLLANQLCVWQGTSQTERQSAGVEPAQTKPSVLCWDYVFEQAQFGLAYGDIATNTLLAVNPVFARQRGYTVDELIGQPVAVVYSPEERLAMAARFPAIDQAGHLVFESVHLRKDGTTFPVLMKVTVIKDAEGRPVSRVVYAQDITERKQAEEALRLSNLRLQQAIQASNMGLWEWNTLTGEVSFSREWKSQLGYDETEFPDSFEAWVSLLHPDDRDRAILYAQEYRDNPVGAFRQDFRLRHKDGAYRWIDSHASFVMEADGRRIRLLGLHADITDRIKAEEALHAQTAQLHALVQGTSDAVFIKDLQGRYLLLNQATGEFVGKSPADVLGHDDTFIFPPDDARAVMDGDRRVMTGGKMLTYEDHVTTADEVRRTFLSTKGPLFDQSGTVTGMFGISRDISERNRFEETLRQSEERYRRYFELGLIGMAVTSLDKGWVQVNGRLCEIFGYSQDELRAKTWTELTHPDDVAPDVAQFSRVLAGEIDGYTMDKRFLHKDGHVIYATISASAVRRPDGSIDHFVALVQDITARHEAEERLRETEERWTYALEGNGDGVWDWNARTNKVFFSNRWKEMLGYDEYEIGNTLEEWLSRVHPDDMSQVMADVRSHFRGETSAYVNEHRVRCKDGSYKWILDRGKVVARMPDGSPLRVVGSHTDITARKQAKAQLYLTQFALERAGDMVFWIEPSSRLLLVNLAACERLGYSKEELLGMAIPDIVPNYEQEDWARHWEDLRQAGQLRFETQHRSKSGEVYPVEVVANFVVFDGKEYNFATVRDISVQKRAKQLLRFSEERFRLVAEATNDILWDWDLVTQVHWWSPNAREKFGFDPKAEPSITVWTDRLHPDDRDRVWGLVNRTLASDAGTVAVEYRFRLADGSYGYFYDRGQIIRDSSGRAVRMIGAMIDMTLTKRAYASLEEAYQRLQRMSRELQTVEANERRRLSRELHDEMGQLLTALKFDLEASRQALSDKPTAEVRRAFERTVRALETTDELFARLRRVVRALRPSVLEELGLKDALEALVTDIQTRSDLVCSVSVEGKVAADPSASAIEAALYRMTQELVTNVVRHAQAMTLSVHLDVDTRQWALTVQDDGIGFNPKAESIVGMGIRGVRERAEILGGRVDVSSAPGAGTTVTVWIPVRPLDVSEETPQAL